MTALRDIVVVLDDSASSAMRLTVAVDLVSRIALFDGAESTVFDGLPTSASRLL